MPSWWQQKPTTAYGTPTSVTLATGAQDVEKGAIFGVAAGTDISLPEKARLLWTDSQHAVLEDSAGNYLNLLHVNTYAKVGDTIAPNTPFAKVSAVVGSVSDPSSGVTYTESGNIVELGLYDSKDRAVSRENIVNGVDQPYNFTGITDPSQMFSDWGRGVFDKHYVGGSGASLGDATLAGSGGGGGAGFLEANPLGLLQSIPLVGTFMQPWLLIVVVLLFLVVRHAK